MQNGNISQNVLESIRKFTKKRKIVLIKPVVLFLNCFKWNGMYHFIFQPKFPGIPCKW